MKKKYEKPIVVIDKKKKKSSNTEKPLYLADGRWCCAVVR